MTLFFFIIGLLIMLAPLLVLVKPEIFELQDASKKDLKDWMPFAFFCSIPVGLSMWLVGFFLNALFAVFGGLLK